ncbi:MAG: mechanosensitive ion channel, partial [Sulfurovum sp.]|nr:mechanosensitive ion channel [Sulfurovum sp.]
EYGMNLIGAILIFYFGKIIARSLSRVAKKMMQRYEVDAMLTDVVQATIYYSLLIVVIIAALGQLGVETTSFMAILGAAGLAVGLALKDTLSNIGAAVIILIFRPFKVGDYISAGGAEGTVENMNLFNTTISPVDNRTIIVPNAAITKGNIVNFSNKPMRRVDHTVGIGYEDDIKKAKEVLYKVLTSSQYALTDPAPLVAVSELADSSVNFTVRVWVKSDDYWNAYYEVIEQIKLALDEHGISIPYPQMAIRQCSTSA